MSSQDTGTGNQSSHGDQAQEQGGGAITQMLRGTVSGLGENVRGIVRGEVELAKTELKNEATQVGKAGGMIAGGGVLGLTGFLFLMQALTFLLSKKLPMWFSASLVGSAMIAIAAAMGSSGKAQLQETNLKPEQTMDSLNDVKDTISQAGRS